MDHKEYTRKITQKSKTSFYYSFLFLPKKKREAIYTVYSFCRHSDDIVDDTDDEKEARRLLDEWRKELDACFDHHPVHPITRALHEVIERFPMPREYFHTLIDGVEMDLTKKRYQTFEELSKYCYHVAAVVGLICIEIFGYRSHKTKDYAVNLGTALQLTNIMRDVGEDARNGRIYLPQEELERFHYSEAELLTETYTPDFVELMRFQEQRAREYYARANECYEKRDHHLMFPAEIMRKIYYQVLQRIAAVQYNVYAQRIRVPNRSKVSIALRTWMGGRLRGILQWEPMS